MAGWSGGMGDGKGRRTADDEEGRKGARAAVVFRPGRFRPVYPLGGHVGRFVSWVRRQARVLGLW